MCWNRLRNGCARPEESIKHWLVAPFWSFEKKLILQYFFVNWRFQIQSFKWFRWKLTELWNIRVWRPSWINPPFWIVISQNSEYFFFMVQTTKICHKIKAQAHEKKITILFFVYFGTHINKIHTIYKQTSVFDLIFSMLLFCFE
jgi:hypothetical protein